MRCFVLGSGGMMPMPGRRLTSVAVRLGTSVVLFDCGEGAQVSVKHLRIGIKALRVVAISHLHADHCLGLPGLLMFRAQCESPGPLAIVGPPGIARFVRHVVDDLTCHVGFPLEFHEWQEQGTPIAFRDDELVLTWARLDHSVLCLGYRLEEHVRPGRFDPDRARALGVPQGALWGRLQHGEAVPAADGRVVRPEEVLGPPRRGRAVCFCTDTLPCAAIGELAAGVDVAFVEGMFLPEHEAEGLEKKHMTVSQAASATARARAGRTLLVHLSPRYGAEDVPSVDQEAARHNPTARAARDLEVLDIPLPD